MCWLRKNYLWINRINKIILHKKFKLLKTHKFFKINYIKKNLMNIIKIGIKIKLTDGDLGSPTLWPHVVRRLTRHSRTRPWDIQGRFHPLINGVSAGDKLALLRGELGVPVWILFTGWLILANCVVTFVSRSGFKSNLRPINGVCDTSKEKSIVLPANSFLQNTSVSL